ncbi:MAG: transcriptional regulator, AraC family [Polyangiaceae bacterium]|jgi:AraC-like DNA-binding protein|nr:transcriptional regulator, AraC family [Polyangiaceae bacterium]
MFTLAARGSSAPSAIAALQVVELDADLRGVLIPRVEVQVVARLGLAARGGVDVHALGARQTVHRKQLRLGQRVVSVRLHLGAAEAVLGAPDAELAGRVVSLEELWGQSAVCQLLEQLERARGGDELSAILEGAIAERVAKAGARRPGTQLVRQAAERLTSANVNAVASELGVSERHLRRVFQETIGVGPKAFAKLSRFRRAVRVAREQATPSWATVALSAGYYDQAHLIREFRTIAGVTPRALLGELRGAQAMD